MSTGAKSNRCVLRCFLPRLQLKWLNGLIVGGCVKEKGRKSVTANTTIIIASTLNVNCVSVHIDIVSYLLIHKFKMS